ncbi:MAG TPA: phosphoribosylanthranilate isomerase [Anaerolineales bacterium]|nr:phosphoribosylanthranilate isomerase [Anaerolineales bacterium]
MNVRVKICGLTRLEDALAAAECGADFLGFILYNQSPRFIEPEAGARITAAVKQRYPAVRSVGVFVNEEVDKIGLLLDSRNYGYAQLSGDEETEDLGALAGRAYKAVRPASPAEADTLAARFSRRDVRPALLLDAHVPGLYGGTGTPADLQTAARLAKDYDLMLAGGLNPDNVAAAVRLVRPWAVDVSSGVEHSPGIKDHDRMRSFIRRAKNAEV